MAVETSVKYTPNQQSRLDSAYERDRENLEFFFKNALKLHKLIETEPIGSLHALVHGLEEIVYSVENKQELSYPFDKLHPKSMMLYITLQQQKAHRYYRPFDSNLETIDELTNVISELRYVLIFTFRHQRNIQKKIDEHRSEISHTVPGRYTWKHSR